MLSHYDMLVIWNHDEYWSAPERTNTEWFKGTVHRGNIARFAPNTCFWRISWEGTTSQYLKLKCNKDSGRPIYDLWRSSVNGAPGKPEAAFLGEQYQHGWNVVRADDQTEEPPAKVLNNHWIFRGTNLAPDTLFGYGFLDAPDSLGRRFRHGIVAGELDNLVTGSASFPIDILAQRYVTSNVSGSHIPVLHQMIFFEDTLSNARAFAQGSGGWGSAIATLGDPNNGDYFPYDVDRVKTITKNIFDHFSKKKYIGPVWADITWNTNVQIDGDVYVKPGKTLTLSGSMTLTINPGVTLYVDGTLIIGKNVTITGGGSIVTRGSGKILVTNSATALASNNSRKLARDVIGNYHLVFETEGEISYEKLTNGGTAISEFRRLSNGVADGVKSNPCIYARDGNILVFNFY